jgi:CRP/FNR family transcriptional regulator, anaerobic regulatory protein
LISDNHQIESLIQQFHFLQLADNRFRDSFFQQAIPTHVAIGSPICDQGMQCQHLALIISGVARVFKLGENGREITLYRIGPGESCILTASCIVSASPFPAFAICEEKIEALVIDSATVKQWTDKYSAWRNYLFSLISGRLGDVISVIEEIAFRRVDQRLADYLLQRGSGDNQQNIKITHQAIASDLGTSREVVSRILKDFEHQGLISVSRGQLQITDTTGLSNKTLDHY